MKTIDDIIGEVLNQTYGFYGLDITTLLASPGTRRGLIREAMAAIGCGVSFISPEDLSRLKIYATKELFPLDFKLDFQIVNIPKT